MDWQQHEIEEFVASFGWPSCHGSIQVGKTWYNVARVI